MATPQPISQTEPTASVSYLHMLWASMAFATMGAIAHKAGESTSWQLVAVARATVAFAFSLFLAWLGGVRLVFWRPRTLWVRSFAGSCSMLCNFFALARLPVSDVLTLMNTTPIWVTLILWLVYKQRPVTGVVWAVLTSIAGIFLIQQPHFQGGKLACLLALIGAFTTSIAMLGLNRMRHIDPRAIVVHFSAVSSVATGTFMFFTGAANFLSPLGNTVSLLYLLMVGTSGVLGQIGMTLAFAKGHATRVSIIGLSQILFGIGFDVLIWHRRINLVSIAGMVLVAAPTAWLLLSESPSQSQQVIEAEMT